MATLSTRGKKRFRVQFYVGTTRHSLTIHGTKVEAEKLRGHITALEQSRSLNIKPPAEVAEWVRGLDDETKMRLVDSGLVNLSSTGGTLADLIGFTNRILHNIAPHTKRNYAQVQKSAGEYFKLTKPLASFTAADAEGFKRWLSKQYGPASIAKRIKHCRQMFNLAVQQEWIARNPFSGIRVKVKVDPERRVFVSREVADKVLAGLRDPEDRLVFALARYGGLRVGSEIRTLFWRDISLDTWLMRLRATKTDSMRVCPIFVELQPYFLALAPGELDELVCPRFCRGTDVAFRNRLVKTLDRLGVDIWPDLMLNCRRTRATEIVERWGARAESDWIGHGADISHRHYQITLQEKIDEATGRGCKSGAD